MKAIFLMAGGSEVASSRYRAIQFAPYLRESGIEAEMIPIPKRTGERWRLLSRLQAFDVTFIQKKLFQVWELAYIRSKARRLIYDLDDAVMYKPGDKEDGASFTRRLNFRQVAKKSDLVIAGNAYLMEEAKKYNHRVEILPTVLDPRSYDAPFKGIKDPEKVTLGWIGSKPNLRYLSGIREVLDRLHSTYKNIEVKVVADDCAALGKVPVVNKRWRIDEEVEDLRSFDIGLMPLPENRWTKGKCGFKLLQYMAVGIPVVCSPVGANREIVQDGYNGFLADTPEAWFSKLSLLTEDAQRRRVMGKNGREIVESKYSLKSAAPQLIEYLHAK